MAASGPDFRPGQLLPGTKYHVVRQLGAGGMGIVYQVVKPPSIQGVLKLMSSELTQHEEFRTRFFDEVRILAQLDHPNIVKVFDYDSLTDGTPYYVMEMLHGRTVRDVIATVGAVPPRVAFEITRQLLEALHAAHTHDVPVVHRDIKPENIFLHAPRHGDPVVKLIDFGVIAVADRSHDGTFVGTWKYAAPEQIRGEHATPATDLYAVGLVLYEMLAGLGPFDHLDSGPLVSKAHLGEVPTPVSRFAPWVPRSIVDLVSSALSKDPRQRPRDAYAFAERLFELEWSSDGKDPKDHTKEGPMEAPLQRILSTVAGATRPADDMAPLGDKAIVPYLASPPSSRHFVATVPGVGNTQDATAPGEDLLLAGLDARPDLPPNKRARESGPKLPGGAKRIVTPRAGQVVIRPSGPDLVSVEGDAEVPSSGPRNTPRSVPTLDAPTSAPKLLAGRGPISGRLDGASLAPQESDAATVRRKPGKLPILFAMGAGAAVVFVLLFLFRDRLGGRAAITSLGSTAVVTPPPEPPPAPAPVPGPVTSVSASSPVPKVSPPAPVVGRTPPTKPIGKAPSRPVAAAASASAAPAPRASTAASAGYVGF